MFVVTTLSNLNGISVSIPRNVQTVIKMLYRKLIIVVPMLDTCRRLPFLGFYFLYKMISLKPYTLTVHPSNHIKQHKSLLPFVPSLKKLPRLHRFIALHCIQHQNTCEQSCTTSFCCLRSTNAPRFSFNSVIHLYRRSL